MATQSTLPALQVQQQQQPDLFSKYSQLMALKNSQQQQQMMQQEAPVRLQALQQQAQGGQLQLQQQQRELDSQNAIMQAYTDSNGDLSKTYATAAKSGKALPSDLIKLREADVKAKTSAFDLYKSQGALAVQQSDMMSDAANAVNDTRLADRPAVYQEKLQHLQRAGIDTSQMPQQYPGEQQFGLIRLGLQTHKNALDEAAKQAKTAKDQADAAKTRGQGDPTSPFYAPSSASVAMGTAPGAAQIQSGEVRQAGAKAGAEAAARQPYEMSLARQRQALSQGDPNAAGRLLVDGDATLQELKSRGATPDFIARALFAAKRLSGGKYNAQQAEAEFSVARSPANVAFFGSANSLLDKGGTLDQLEEAGKNIPQSQIPALNSLADWEKAATGSGPLAKYASIALGVADDYSKVMSGSSQGSDTSRSQALNLIKANLSHEGRTGSVEGIRGAVGSQKNSRIGKNPILQRMYGDVDGAQPAQGGSGLGVKLSDAMSLPQNRGKSQQQVIQDIQAHGHTVIQ